MRSADRFLGLMITLIISLNAVFSEELLELSCVDAQECTHFKKPGLNVTCSDGQCRCSSTDKNSGAGDKMIKCSPMDVKLSNIIGGHCPCRMPHADCNKSENICYCGKQFMASTDKRRCLRESVALGEYCELNAQCQAADHHAVCESKSKKCSCRPDFIPHNGTCISVADPNTTCENNQDCRKHGVNVTCLIETHKCTCPNGHIKAQNKSECLPVVSYHENCTDHQQCQTNLGPGGDCINGTCQCTDMHYWLQKQVETETKTNVTRSSCVRIIEIGEYCDEDKDCYHHQFPDEEQTMGCIFGECNCKWGYYSINNMECHKSSEGTLFKPVLYLAILTVFIPMRAVI